jgi:hypothetical protein
MAEEKQRKTQTRPRSLSWAIAINALSWLLGALVYVVILLTALRFGNQEEIDNVVAALNLIWVIPLFVGLWRLWRQPLSRSTLKLVFFTQSISLFYSIRSPLVTTLRYAFLTNTEATIGVVIVDIVVSLLMAATTSAYLVRYCWQRLSLGEA